MCLRVEGRAHDSSPAPGDRSRETTAVGLSVSRVVPRGRALQRRASDPGWGTLVLRPSHNLTNSLTWPPRHANFRVEIPTPDAATRLSPQAACRHRTPPDSTTHLPRHRQTGASAPPQPAPASARGATPAARPGRPRPRRNLQTRGALACKPEGLRGAGRGRLGWLAGSPLIDCRRPDASRFLGQASVGGAMRVCASSRSTGGGPHLRCLGWFLLQHWRLLAVRVPMT
jgi:hypothetical protein